jgi:hypothetical protein
MKVPVEGGAESAVLAGVTTFWWSVVQSGIVLITRESDFDAIDRYDVSGGKVFRIGRLAARAGPIGSQLNVSPDGRWALVPHERRTSDLMIVDEFR